MENSIFQNVSWFIFKHIFYLSMPVNNLSPVNFRKDVSNENSSFLLALNWYLSLQKHSLVFYYEVAWTLSMVDLTNTNIKVSIRCTQLDKP